MRSFSKILRHLKNLLEDEVIDKVMYNETKRLFWYDKKDIEKLDSKIAKSTFIGKKIGEEIIKQKIKKVMFDRSGYIYHGRIKAFVDAVRESGLNI